MKKKLLFIRANPIDTEDLRLDNEENAIRSILRGSNAKDEYEIEARGAVTLKDLVDLMLNEKPHILHIAGHGGMEKQGASLFFEDDENYSTPISVTRLVELLAEFENLEFLFMNTCYSLAEGDEVDCIKYVIGMHHEVPNEVALQFSEVFYNAFFTGESHAKSFTIAKRTVNVGDEKDALIPVFIENQINKPVVESLAPGATNHNGLGVILLGASDFSKSEEFLTSSTAFKTSYEQVKEYFSNDAYLGIKEEHCLDLFDQDLDQSDVTSKIREYVLMTQQAGITDVILYYVGHGLFDDQGFVLALKNTVDHDTALTGLLFSNLAKRIIAKEAAHLNTYLIVDCCYSGAAGEILQSADTTELITQQFKTKFPTKGASLMCSSSADLPSLIVEDRNITMFSDGLTMALTQGSASIRHKYLTLEELCQVTFGFIKENYNERAIQPRVHSINGAGSENRIFPNYELLSKPFDIFDRGKRIVHALGSNEYVNACDLLMDYADDFSKDSGLVSEIVVLSGDFKGLIKERDSISKEDMSPKDRLEVYRLFKDDIALYVQKIITLVQRIESQEIIE